MKTLKGAKYAIDDESKNHINNVGDKIDDSDGIDDVHDVDNKDDGVEK